MMSSIVDCEFDTLEIGARVRVVFKPGVDGKVTPMFISTAPRESPAR
jgi:uncharacterized OB-fold protein